MPDSQEQPEKKDQSAPPEEAKAPEVKTVPYERFQEVNEGFKALKDQLAELKTAEEKRVAEGEEAKKKQLEEQNRFKELYETAEAEKATTAQGLESLTAKVETMTKALTAQWDAQKGLIPEMFLDLVEEMPIEKRIEWLSTNAEKLTEKEKGNGTPRRTQSRSITPPEARENGSRPFRKIGF